MQSRAAPITIEAMEDVARYWPCCGSNASNKFSVIANSLS
jgi:hypothetical protein